MADKFDIFNLDVSDVDMYNVKSSGESVLYRPSADQGKDGIYRSLIRFIPNPKNPQKSLVRKFVYWLEDVDGNGSYFDSPSTVGDKCPVQDLFFKLRNSESVVDKKMSEKLKRREVFYSIVQIIKDTHNQDVEGKYKIFKFGYKIKQKIDEELNPQFEEPTQIFDLFEGKNFELVITKQGGFNNYDSSKFQGTKSVIMINGMSMDDTQESREAILTSLESAPEIESFDYRPWTDEDRTKVENILNQYRSPGEAVQSIVTPSTPIETHTEVPKIPELESTVTSENSKGDKPKEDSGVEKKEVSDEEDLNSFLDGLDL